MNKLFKLIAISGLLVTSQSFTESVEEYLARIRKEHKDLNQIKKDVEVCRTLVFKEIFGGFVESIDTKKDLATTIAQVLKDHKDQPEIKHNDHKQDNGYRIWREHSENKIEIGRAADGIEYTKIDQDGIYMTVSKEQLATIPESIKLPDEWYPDSKIVYRDEKMVCNLREKSKRPEKAKGYHSNIQCQLYAKYSGEILKAINKQQ